MCDLATTSVCAPRTLLGSAEYVGRFSTDALTATEYFTTQHLIRITYQHPRLELGDVIKTRFLDTPHLHYSARTMWSADWYSISGQGLLMILTLKMG